MTIRSMVFLIFALLTFGSKAGNDIHEPNHETQTLNQETEFVFEQFSTAVTSKNIPLFVELTDPRGIYLVRKFTSGNLGGRGEELSELTQLKKLNEKFQFPIKNQTPYSLGFLFHELPIKSFANLSHRSLPSEVEDLHFDTWVPFLKESLTGAPEVKDGMPIRLSSANGKYHVYAEAQIIDEILVGGFAVFSKENGKMKLVALIDLL